MAKFPQGTVFTGKVTHIEPFGAFIELLPGAEGLIPVSRLGRGRRLASPREVLTEGQELLVEVDSIDVDRHRFSLKPVDERVKALKPGTIEPGAKMEGIVESVQTFGVFVKLAEDKTGLLHVSETGIPKGTSQFGKMEHQFPPDSKVEVVVKSVDGNRISLTLPAEWEKAQNAEEANNDVSTWLDDQKKASGSPGLSPAMRWTPTTGTRSASWRQPPRKRCGKSDLTRQQRTKTPPDKYCRLTSGFFFVNLSTV